jgi:GNAT superfamily N-acetyltransferase
MSIPITIRRITHQETAPLRHAVLWPTVPLDKQLQAFDEIDTTRHYGAFLSNTITDIDERYHPAEHQHPIGCLTLVHIPPFCARPIPEGILNGPVPTHHVQLRKFAVIQPSQGKGVGRALFRYVLGEIHDIGLDKEEESTWLHLDSRSRQAGFYEALGMSVLGEGFIKYGPTGDGPGVEYVRMGMVVHRTPQV